MKRFLFLYFFLFCSLLTFATDSNLLTIHLETAGTLWDKFDNLGVNPKEVTKLKVTGVIDQDDFRVMNKIMTALEFIDLSETNIKTIPQSAFDGKSTLRECLLPADVTSIETYAFRNCSLLQNIPFSQKIESIGSSAFSECRNMYGDLVFSKALRTIDSHAFQSCSSLKSIVFGNSYIYLSDYAFQSCSSLKSVDMSLSQLYEIPYSCFSGCSNLATVILPNQFSTDPMMGMSGYNIRMNAFQSTAIAEITLPATVQSIESYAFSYCYQLKRINILKQTVIGASENAFAEVDKANCMLYVPTGTTKAYSFANEWSSFANIESLGIKYEIGKNGTLYLNNEKIVNGTVYFNNEKNETFTAIPSPGYLIDQVKFNKQNVEVVDGSFTVGENVMGATLDVSFILKKFDINVSTTGSGTLTLNDATLSPQETLAVDSAAIVQFAILANEGHILKSIKYNGKECVAQQNNSIYVTPFTVANATVEVEFAPISEVGNTYKVDVAVGNNGAAIYKNTPLLSQTNLIMVEGETCTFDMIPNLYYMIDQVLYNGTDLANQVVDNRLTIENIQSAGNIAITFKPNPNVIVDLNTPGALAQELGDEVLAAATRLELIGHINSNDFTTMRDAMPLLSVIDLSQAICSGDGAYGGMENMIPYSAFCKNTNTETPEGKITLREVILPKNIQWIGGYAFMGCTNLTKINFEECTSLSTIEGHAFYKSGLSRLDLSATKISSLNNYEFRYSPVQEIILPSTLTSFDSQFTDNNNLVKVDLSLTQLTEISNCFSNCKNLEVVTLPATIKSITSSAFSSCEKLKIVNWADLSQLTSLGSHAFNYCRSLENIKLPASVTSIKEYAFHYCNLSEIDLSNCNQLTKIESGAFQSNSNAATIKLPASVTVIDQYAFNGCNVTEIIELPAGLTTIGEAAFSINSPLIRSHAIIPPTLGNNALGYSTTTEGGTTGLVAVFVPEESVSAYKRTAGWEEYIILGGENRVDIEVTTPGNLAIDIMEQAEIAPALVTHMKVRGKLNRTDFDVIRSNMTVLYDLDLTDADMEVIPEKAFLDKKILMNFKAPQNLLIIENSAFKGCSSLSGKLTLPATLSVIGDAAFENCISLEEVEFSENLTSIGISAFRYCRSLKQQLSFPNKLEVIKGNAFRECNNLYGAVVMPASLKVMSNDYDQNNWSYYGCTFQGCNKIESIDLSACEQMTSIAESAFESCTSLIEVKLPESLNAISKKLFSYCNKLESVNFPKSIKVIEENAFNNCSSLRLADMFSCDSLTSIKESAFDYCKSLTTVNLPASVNNYGNYAFRECRSLANLSILNKTPATLGEYVFRRVPTDVCVLSIPTDSYYDYLVAAQWGAFVQMRKAISIALDQGASMTFTNNATFEDENGNATPATYATRNGQTTSTKGDAVVVDGSSIYVKKDETVSFFINPDENVAIQQVLYNDVDVTAQVVGNVYTTPQISDKASLKVKLLTTGNIAVTAINLNKTALILKMAESAMLTATVLPHNATHKEVVWTSNNETVALVDEYGNVTAVGAGTAIVSATGENGMRGECAVTVLSNDYYFTVDNNDVFINSTANIPVSMHNQGEVVAFQCDIYLPEGVTMNTYWGDYNITLSERAYGHNVSSAKQADGSIRTLVYSTNNNAISGNDGVLFNIPIRITGDEGSYEIAIKNIHVTGSNSIDIALPNVTSNIIINGYNLGDSNGDGKVTISDVTNTTNYILGNYVNNFIVDAADVNQDKVITIADVAGTVNIVLSTDAASQSIEMNAKQTFDKLYIEDFNIQPGETKSIQINLDDENNYAALQCDIQLPEGLEFVTNENGCLAELSTRKSNSHLLATALQNNGTLRIATYSSDNAEFLNSEGALLSLTIKAKEEMPVNLSAIELSNILLSTQLAEEYVAESTLTNVNIVPTSINNEEADALLIRAEGQYLHIRSFIAQTIYLISTDGKQTLLNVEAGDNQFYVEQKGVYIINNKKILIK